jgi:hypothetical protein
MAVTLLRMWSSLAAMTMKQSLTRCVDTWGQIYQTYLARAGVLYAFGKHLQVHNCDQAGQ